MKRAFEQPDWRKGLDPKFVEQADAYTKQYWQQVNSGKIFEPDLYHPEATCPRCQDRGMFTRDVPVTDALFGKMVACPDCAKGEEVAREQWRRKYQQCEFPRQFQGFTFDSFNALNIDMQGKRPAYLAAVQFVQNPDHMVDLFAIYQELGMAWDEGRDMRPRNSLVFHGLPGMGKTGLMSAIVNELLARGETCLYARALDLIEEYQDTYRQDSEVTTREVLLKYKTAPVLFLDEFNIHRTSDDKLDKIEQVVRYRYNNMLPTLITTNSDQNEFADMWKERSGDAALAMAHWLYVGGAKLRQTDPSTYDETTNEQWWQK